MDLRRRRAKAIGAAITLALAVAACDTDDTDPTDPADGVTTTVPMETTTAAG